MHRSCPAARIVAVIALLLVAPSSFGEAIRWHYSGSVEAANGGPFVQFGVEDQQWFDPATGDAGLTPYQILGRIDATFAGTGAGRETIHAASYDVTNLQAFQIGDEWALNRPMHFFLRVTVVDEDSGRSADLEYIGTGHSNGFFLTGTGVISLGLDSRTDLFTLGDHNYTVSASVRESESAAHLELEIEATHANPEPATLSLAGVGLAGVGVLRRRRR
jgi:PEP-CTERM motif-containing protein